MGADLIVYILEGPREVKLTPQKREDILKKVRKSIKLCAAFRDGKLDANKLPSSIEEFDAQFIADLDPEVVLDNFIDLWNGKAAPRDAAWRFIGTGKKQRRVLVCGELSWGDTPSGYGFETCRNADLLNIDTMLGVR